MSSFVDCLCCPFLYCCQCFKTQKEKRSPRKKTLKPKVPSIEQTSKDWETRQEFSHPDRIRDQNLTKEYKVPNDYPSIEECFRNQGLELKELINSGGYSDVYKMVDLKDKKVFAAKRIPTGDFLRSPRMFQSIKAELFIMIRAKKHPNIVTVFKHFIITDFKAGKEFFYIIMELANGGTILTKMKGPGEPPSVKRLPEKTVKIYMRQISNGLRFLHSLKVAHKDLKLNNLLVFVAPDGTETVKITDFGLSRIRYDEKRKVVLKEAAGRGTVQFMSPQILRLFIYDEFYLKVDKLHTYDPFRADIWALGVCLYLMVFGNYPFPFGYQSDNDLINCYKLMKQRKYELTLDPNTLYSDSCLKLISDLLEPNPDKRLTAHIVLQHRWFAENN